MRKCVSACVLKTYDQFTVQAHAKGNRFIPATYSPQPNGQHSNVKDRFVLAHATRLHSAHVGTRRSTGAVVLCILLPFVEIILCSQVCLHQLQLTTRFSAPTNNIWRPISLATSLHSTRSQVAQSPTCRGRPLQMPSGCGIRMQMQVSARA